VQTRVVSYDHPDAAALITEVQQEYVRRYGEEDITPVDPAEFSAPRGLFLVGYLDGRPVACGGWRAHDADDPEFADGDAEIKRMYVAPSARGRGLARALLAELERTAAAAGRRRLVLETGLRQPEAIALYSSSGYAQVARFGAYRDYADSVCFAKPISVAAALE
jgi:GNAT superfamily N-acetyltransferase